MRTVIPKAARLVPPEAKRVFKGIIYDVYHWPQEMYDGRTETFEMLKRPDTIKTMAVKDGKILLIAEEQPTSSELYDFPGGRHDHESETEEEAAKRELLEETGLVFKNWRLIDAYQPTGKIEHIVYTFLATDFVSEQKPQLDGGEKIEVRYLTLDEIQKLLDDPKSKHLPKELLSRVHSIEDILALPEYEGIQVA